MEFGAMCVYCGSREYDSGGKTVHRADCTLRKIGQEVPDGIEHDPRFGNAEALICQLENALTALCGEKSKCYPDGCWCEACKGNPMYKDHTGACKMAQRAMKGRW